MTKHMYIVFDYSSILSVYVCIYIYFNL